MDTSTVDTTPLDEDDFFDIHKLLQSEDARCYQIGTYLKLKQSLLGTVKTNASNSADALSQIITNWLQHNYNVVKFGPPTWKALAEAVQAPGGGNNTALAEEIARQHQALSNGASHPDSRQAQLPGGYGGQPANVPPQGGYSGHPTNFGNQPPTYPPQVGQSTNVPSQLGQAVDFPPQQGAALASSNIHPSSGQAQVFEFSTLQHAGSKMMPPQAQVDTTGAVPIVAASSDKYQPNRVDADGGGGIIQYEAFKRSTHKPLLKLHDDDSTTQIHPRDFRQTDEDEDLEYYPMNSPTHGVALIINNGTFTDRKRHEKRVGTERDEYNLLETFKYLGYRTIVCNDLTKTQIRYIFAHLDTFLKDSDRQAKTQVPHDSFICCILSHGNKEGIIGSDSQAIGREKIEELTADSKLLESKPKIFFLQTCRSEPKRVEDDASGSDRAHFYICFSTVYGAKSYTDRYTGSWFITETCKILCEYSTCDSINNQFQIRLNKSVSTNPVYRHVTEDGQSVGQEPTCSNQLHRYVHFFDNSEDCNMEQQ